MSDSLNFDLTPVEVPVTIGGEKYVLCEASETAASRYQDVGIEEAEWSDGQIVKMKGISKRRVILLTECLKKVVQGLKGEELREPVSALTIRSWPVRITTPLYEKAEEISGLEEGTEEVLLKQIADLQKRLEKIRKAKGKNSPSATPAG